MEQDVVTQWKYNKRNQMLLTEWLRQNQGKTPSNRPQNCSRRLANEDEFQKVLLGEAVEESDDEQDYYLMH